MGQETSPGTVGTTETPYRKTPPTNYGSVAEAGFTKTPPAKDVTNYLGSNPNTDDYRTVVVPPTAVADAAPGATPVPAVLPTIAGTTTVGQTLTVTPAPSPWVPAAASYQYQWFRDDVAIGGATAVTRVLTAADAGKRLTCRVTGIHATLGGSTPVFTAPTAVIAAA